MKIEFKILIYSMINNLVIAVIKVIGGVTLGLGSLLADGLHTFSDFITDIVCMIGSKISKRKPTKYHPFGFGKIEYLTNLFIGVILFLLSIFIIIHSLGTKTIIPPVSLLWLLVITFILKLVAIIIMNKVGEKINSQVLITSVEESKTDLYSSVGVMIITILLQFSNTYPILKYADVIGSILIALIVLKTSLKVLISNSLSLIGEVETNEETIKKIENFITEWKEVKNQEIELIKYGSYYKLQLILELDSKLSLRKVTNLENKIKRKILRHRSFHIKYVTIYVTNKIDEK